jgi:hypothetical protein
MDLAGVILDIYDDPKGLILRSKVAGRPLPEKLASAQLLDVADLDRLPDRLFALVAENNGDIIRKYAMNDEAHLATSLIYFDECGHLLPDEVRQKVASNLITGCAWHDLTPPESLVKVAFVGTALNVLDAVGQARGAISSSMQHGRENMQALRAAQASGAKVASGREIQLTLSEDQAMQRAEGPESGYIFGPLSQFSNHDKTHKKLDHQLAHGEMIEDRDGRPVTAEKTIPHSKKADLTGTEAMTHQTGRQINPHPTPQSRALGKKASLSDKLAQLMAEGWQHCGSLTGYGPRTVTKVASSVHFALPHERRYPIDTAGQIKQAAAYFDDHVYELPLVERRLFAQSVLHRADELGVKVAGALLEYGGDGYGPFIESELHARRASFEGTGFDAVYEVLLENWRTTTPAVMADMLKQADDETGAALVYGRPVTGFRDPYAAVYGQPKLAEVQPDRADVYSWRSGGDYVNGFMLKALASRKADLDTTFGEGFSQSFAKDPVGIFESMPDPQKVVLSRLASDNSSQTFRI